MRRVVQALTLQRMRDTRRRGRVLRSLSKSLGLVYFGAVDHRHDDHDVVRGLTLSTTHRDAHYMVGSFDGYDIALVDRIDSSGKDVTKWVIIQVRLKIDHAVPHIILVPHVHQARFDRSIAGLRHVQPIDSLVPEQYPHDVTQRYTLYGPAHDTLTVQQYITPQRAHSLAIRLWPNALELKDGMLLVYIQEHRLDKTVLAATVESALWLADQIDDSV